MLFVVIHSIVSIVVADDDHDDDDDGNDKDAVLYRSFAITVQMPSAP